MRAGRQRHFVASYERISPAYLYGLLSKPGKMVWQDGTAGDGKQLTFENGKKTRNGAASSRPVCFLRGQSRRVAHISGAHGFAKRPQRNRSGGADKFFPQVLMA